MGAGLAWVHDAGWPWLAGLGVAAVLVVASWSWYLRLRVDLQLSVNNAAGVADPDKAAFSQDGSRSWARAGHAA